MPQQAPAPDEPRAVLGEAKAPGALTFARVEQGFQRGQVLAKIGDVCNPNHDRAGWVNLAGRRHLGHALHIGANGLKQKEIRVRRQSRRANREMAFLVHVRRRNCEGMLKLPHLAWQGS